MDFDARCLISKLFFCLFQFDALDSGPMLSVRWTVTFEILMGTDG